MQVSYGGIPFQVVKTNSFVREPVLTDDRTELLFMRTTYDLTMIYNTEATSYVGDGNGFIGARGALPALTDVAIRYHLLKPRQQFVLSNDDVNASPVLVAPAPGSDRDPDHGPKPVSCSVDNLTPKTWRVSWRVVVASIECGPQGALISNRYTQA